MKNHAAIIVARPAASRTLTWMLVALLLGACNVIPEREPVDLFELPATTLDANSGAAISGGLRLLTPDSSDVLSGTRLLILNNNSFQAWPAARWTAPMPQLWRDWLLDAFWRDGRFSELSTDSTVLQAERSLSGMLRAMHTERSGGRMTAVIRFDAQLIESASRTIIASQRFEAREPLSGESTTAAVIAMGSAADTLARELIEWAAQHSSR